jgi:hypothetical protein
MDRNLEKKGALLVTKNPVYDLLWPSKQPRINVLIYLSFERGEGGEEERIWLAVVNC